MRGLAEARGNQGRETMYRTKETTTKCEHAFAAAVPCALNARIAIMKASGCPCLVVRAAPFCFFGDRRPQLAPAVTLRFGALTPCCGHGLDYRRCQPHHRSGKCNNLSNQFHGQITSFRKRRRCQHTGLTPLTASNYSKITRTNVPIKVAYAGNLCQRRAA